MFKSFLVNAAAFLIWSLALCIITLAPIVLNGPEAVAAMVAAMVAACGITTIIFWESI
jgi:hypothetical protein